MEEAEIVIIGSGVVGLSIAECISKKIKSIILVEKNISFGQETSSHNSEVIHGGMYYPKNSLKARLCVEGRRLLYKICEDNKIHFRKTGKLIIASCEDEMADLNKIMSQGQANNVEGLSFLGSSSLKEIEPSVSGIAAILSKETGIIDSHKLMEYFLDEAKSNGTIVSFNSEVVGIEKISSGYKVAVKNGSDLINLEAKIVINSAGLDSDLIAAMAGIDIKKNKYELSYCKGEYFRLSNKKSVFMKRLIYPVPKPKSGGLGIHATLDLSGGVRLGPDDRYLKNRNKDYTVDISKRFGFYNSAKKLMPFIEEEDLSADISGIRPKLQYEGGEFRDFVIKEESDSGLRGFINLIGIESPGLTASPAIAKHVESMIINKN